jgi:hypothetical protein
MLWQIVSFLLSLSKSCVSLTRKPHTIIQLWKDHPEGISDRKIAEVLDRPQRTFADQMKKYRTELRKVRGY